MPNFTSHCSYKCGKYSPVCESEKPKKPSSILIESTLNLLKQRLYASVFCQRSPNSFKPEKIFQCKFSSVLVKIYNRSWSTIMIYFNTVLFTQLVLMWLLFLLVLHASYFPSFLNFNLNFEFSAAHLLEKKKKKRKKYYAVTLNDKFQKSSLPLQMIISHHLDFS